jgi:hypothetical protein
MVEQVSALEIRQIRHAENTFEILCLADIGLLLPNTDMSMCVLEAMVQDESARVFPIFKDCFLSIAHEFPSHSFHQILNMVKRSDILINSKHAKIV